MDGIRIPDSGADALPDTRSSTGPEMEERIIELWLDGASSYADIARRTGEKPKIVARICKNAAKDMVKYEPKGERYAQRWLRARRMRLEGLARRMASAQEELSRARQRRAAAEEDELLDNQVRAWTDVIGRIEDRMRDIVKDYTDAMGAVPPGDILAAEISEDIQQQRRAEAFLIGGGHDGQKNARADAPAGPRDVPQDDAQVPRDRAGPVCPAGRDDTRGDAA